MPLLQSPTDSRVSPPRSRVRVQTSSTHAERAEQYAREVCADKILACEWVKLACKRHLDDRKTSRRREFPWKFDAAKANHFCEFFEGLPHVKDDFLGHAAHGELFKLEPWQIFILSCVFGWVDKARRNRRFLEAYIEVPRKNGKTPMAAGIGLYCLAADGEYGAEVFAGAKSKEQAGEVFGAARSMALSSADLREAFGIYCNVASIVIAATNSSFKPVKGKPADGPSPSCVIADEYHEYTDNSLISWARTGFQARRQPLLFEITTAGSDLASACYDKHLEVQEVLAGRRVNERLFGIIYTINAGVDWTSLQARLMANPNHGVSVNPETLEHDIFQASQSAAYQNEVKTKNLNIWCNADVAWMNMEKWDACADPNLRIEDFANDPCVEGIDLASRTDTVSTVRLFKRQQLVAGIIEDHYYCFSRHYLNERQVTDPRNTHYQDWVARGFLIQTPGDVTSYLKVAEDLARDSRELNLRELCFDPFHAAPLIQFMRDRDDWAQSVECVDLKQTYENISSPMKEVEAVVLSGHFHFNGNPVLSWMISNTLCHISDQKENWYPARAKRKNKIDGTVALILAYARLSAHQVTQYTNVDDLRFA